MFKMAGAEAALTELGLLPQDGMEKEGWAWLGTALNALKGWGGKLLSRFGSKAVASGAGEAATAARGAQAAGAAAKGTQAAAEAAPGLWARTGGRALDVAAAPFGRAGNWAVQRGGTALRMSPETIAKIQGMGKGMAREAIGFGALSGGLEAAMAEPGHRGEAFMRGFGGGALGGLAWRGAGNVASAGLKRGLGKHFAGVEAASQQPWLAGKMSLGQRAKGWGAKALIGGVPFAAGMGASMMMPTFHGEGGPQTQGQRFAPYVARAAGGTMMGAYPQHPMGYAYNPNLPMPQNEY
jgi:hypothetical protein